MNMKKTLTVLLLVVMTMVMVTPAWAAPENLADEMKTVTISAEIKADSLPLADFLARLSKECGISLVAVPEAADIKVDMQVAAGQTLEQILAELAHKYYVTYTMNAKNKAIIVYKGAYYDGSRGGMMHIMLKTEMSQAAQFGAAVVPAPAGSYNGYGSFNTEEYNRIYDNGFQNAFSTPVSTFSIDVDTASYSNIRRFINSGKLPQPDAVRTEEMLNYFTYDYPQPQGAHPFSVVTEVSQCPWQPQHQLIMIGLQGQNIKLDDMSPSNLVFLIDVSGSMSAQNKLPLLKTVFKMLVKQLRAQDSVAIVVYAGRAGVVLEPTSGSEKDKINKAIDSLEAGGSTAGGEGLKLAYKLAKENFMDTGNNRVILATDGDFNVGVSSEGELTRLIEARRDDGIFLSVLGFGMGNIKDNKMEALADKGNGNYAFIDNVLEAQKVMVGQLAGTLYTIAKDVKFQVEFNPAKVKNYRLIGYENRALEQSDFNNDKKDAGDMGAGQSVTALYEIIPADSAESIGKIDPLVYQHSQLVPSDELLQVKIRYKKPTEANSILFSKSVGLQDINSNPSDNFSFAAAVTEYAMLLRNSEFKGQSFYAKIIAMAKKAKGQDEEGYRAEFIKLVEVSQLLDER